MEIESEDGTRLTPSKEEKGQRELPLAMSRDKARVQTKQLGEDWLSSAEYYYGIKALLEVMSTALAQKDRLQNGDVQRAINLLIGVAAQKESEAFRNAFMLGMSQTPEDRKVFQTVAYNRFMEEGIDIMHLLGSGDKDSEWNKKSVKRFRKMLRKAFNIPLKKKKKTDSEVEIPALSGGFLELGNYPLD